MKINLPIIIIITTLASSYCFSQDLPKKINKFHFGFTSTINTAFIHPEEQSGSYASTPGTEFIPKVGLKIGGIIKYDLSKRFSLTSGLSYGTRKMKIQGNGLISNTNSQPEAIFTSDEFQSWLEIPINLNFVFNPKSNTKLFMDVGFSTRRLLSAKRSQAFTRSSGNTTSGPELFIAL